MYENFVGRSFNDVWKNECVDSEVWDAATNPSETELAVVVDTPRVPAGPAVPTLIVTVSLKDPRYPILSIQENDFNLDEEQGLLDYAQGMQIRRLHRPNGGRPQHNVARSDGVACTI
jgi:hypothetical protein